MLGFDLGMTGAVWESREYLLAGFVHLISGLSFSGGGDPDEPRLETPSDLP